MSQQKHPVAIFDVDGTVFRSSLLIELFDELVAERTFPPEARTELEGPYERWLNREGEYEDYIKAVVSVFEHHIKGMHYADIIHAAELVLTKHRKRVYRYSRDLIQQLHRDGYFLLAISHSPKMILEGFCRELGFDKVYGLLYETGPSSKFTGGHMEEHIIFNKANVVRRAVEKEGLSLAGSIGVGDTESDIPFLEMVEHPICFNPNSGLYRFARLNNWKVVVERKDVIYEM